jgi:hypothetical protein
MTNETQKVLTQIEYPKSTQGLFELPCGYLSPDGQLHSEVVVKEMTGAEEDLLASRQMTPLRKFSELIGRCVTRVGTITDRGQISAIVRHLTVGDRIFLMFAIRRVTIGNAYDFSKKCPECDKEGSYSVNLAELEVKKMKEPMRRIYDVTLPSGKTARVRVSTGEDEERISKLEKETDAISKGLLMRLELFDGKPPELSALKEMSWKDRQALKAEMNKLEGGLDTSVDIACASCGYEFKTDLEVSAGFFFPQEG